MIDCRSSTFPSLLPSCVLSGFGFECHFTSEVFYNPPASFFVTNS